MSSFLDSEHTGGRDRRENEEIERLVPPSISFLSLLHVLVLVFGVTCRLLKL